MGGPENGNFPLLYVMKMSLHRGWVVLKSLKTPLRNIKMVPYPTNRTLEICFQGFEIPRKTIENAIHENWL